jgi:ABC-type lipoprotein release transport system permease subunit
MSKWRFVWRSLRFYWRTHLGVLAGVMLAATILVGALVVGDSVRFTLERMALARLGKVELALMGNDRFFRDKLAGELAEQLQATAAPVLMVRGVVTTPRGNARASDVQVVGVDESFWKLSLNTSGKVNDVVARFQDDDLIINERLADRLGAQSGATLQVRVEKTSDISRDAPLSGKTDATSVMRGKVTMVADADAFGRFSLQASQVSPLTVFMRKERLQKMLDRDGKANVLLLGGAPVPASSANEALAKAWTLEDAALERRELPDRDIIELRTDRVFLDTVVSEAAAKTSTDAMGVLTYFVNQVQVGENVAWYSIVSAVGPQAPGLLPEGLADDEIIFNEWLAEYVSAKVGDEVTLKYYVVGEGRELIEKERKFRLHSIVSIQGAPADAELLPKYPGLYGTKDCGEWEPGIPMDRDNLSEKDQEYWETYQGTPKAFISLKAGQEIWQNRFGNLTALRWSKENAPEAAALAQHLKPSAFGLYFQPVREQALAASRESLDFGHLFIGFSFFLIIAALMLAGLLFVINLEQRSEEMGLLLAVGFRPKQARRLFWMEGMTLALLGTLAGTWAGAFYTRLALHGLATVWQRAVGTSEFYFHAEPATLATGAVSSLVVAMVAIAWAARGQSKRSASQLLAGGWEMDLSLAAAQSRSRSSLWMMAGGLAGALVLVAMSGGGRSSQAAGTFFGAGACLLVAGLGLSRWSLGRLLQSGKMAGSLAQVGRRGAARRPGRSVTTVVVLASGIFLLVAVNAFRHDPLRDAQSRSSGTGGFALFGQTAIPIYENLNDTAVREVLGLRTDEEAGLGFVSLRVREGDDASCLNLNRAQQPRVYGVRPGELIKRGAFTIAGGEGWEALEKTLPDGTIPAIGDMQTVTWALGKKVGDTVRYTDDRGNVFEVRIMGVVAASILQGGLLISERNFVERFPASSGYRVFLVDANWGRIDETIEELMEAFKDKGMELVPAWKRLAEFQAVENTYLGIFQTLGGLGVLLGSVGLGVVVLRNVLERRGELALLRAVGFRKRSLQWMVVSEHWLLIVLGVAVGTVAAVIAVLPALTSPGAEVPYRFIGLTVLAIAVGGLLWSALAALAALRGELLQALRNE